MTISTRVSITLAMLIALSLTAWPAQAAQIFNFTFSGYDVSASGTLTATLQNGYYQATSATGTFNGQALALIPNTNMTPGPGSYSTLDEYGQLADNVEYDDELFLPPSPPPNGPLQQYLDSYGLLFTLNGDTNPKDTNGS